MHDAPRDHDRLLTGAYLALSGVAVGAGIAWMLLRPAPAPAGSAPAVAVPPVSAPVASASPLEPRVYPSSAFSPTTGDQRPMDAGPTAGSAVTVVSPPGTEESEPAISPSVRGGMSAPGSEVILFHQTSSAFLIDSSGGTVPIAATLPNGINGALSHALAGIDPYLAKGYALQGDTGSGDLPVNGTTTFTYQLLKGKDYCFCMGTDVKWSVISVHVYDAEGSLAERKVQESFSPKPDGGFAVAVISPPQTGTYFVMVKVEVSSEQRTPWGLVYALK